jgi:hypothetical protein
MKYSENNIGNDGATVTSDALRNGNTALTTLYLGANGGSLSGPESRAFNDGVAGTEALLSQPGRCRRRRRAG